MTYLIVILGVLSVYLGAIFYGARHLCKLMVINLISILLTKIKAKLNDL